MEQDPQWTLVKDLFLAAVELRAEERARYLAEHCPTPSVRREVEEMLAANDHKGLLATHTLEAATISSPPSPLSPGSRLNHYVVKRKLGSGGMGWVYEATDENLRRTVAIKVLPPVAVHEEQRRRFQREAQSASALNHPNIVTVHEVGRADGIDFIVMERIEGETLRQKIGPNGMELRKALRYAVQIADALAAAHDAGIVHRDLKPGNVMITERELVKVLDFGLAKVAPKRRGQGGDGVSTDSPYSELGQVVGTVAYMSPEQAEGKPVDGRSDIFSFGSVLFEMLSGHRAFGSGGLDTLEAIVHQEPRLNLLPQSLPRGLVRLLVKSLAKRPGDRWQNIADIRMQIEDLVRDLEAPPVDEPHPRRSRGALIAAAVTGALLAGAIALFFRSREQSPAPEPVLRMITADSGLNSAPALSRDGKLLAFASDRSKEGNLDIWLQQIGGRDMVRLTRDAADESDPDFSPDGTRIAFRSEKDGGGIYVVSSLGGESPVLIAPRGRDPRFSPDGRWIAYWTGRDGTLFPGSSHLHIVESGGGPQRAIHPEIPAAVYPIWSPDGKSLLAKARVDRQVDWFVIPLEPSGKIVRTGAISVLRKQGLMELQAGLNLRMAPIDWIAERDRHRLLFAPSFGDVANLWEIDLDPEKGTVQGLARRISRGPGRQVRAAHSATENTERIAFADEELNYDIWSLPVDAETGAVRGSPLRLTVDHSQEWSASLSWDGTRLGYINRRGGSWFLRTRDLATGEDISIISSPVHIYNGRLSGDGSRMLYSTAEQLGDGTNRYGIFSTPRTGGAVEKLCECGTLMGVSTDGTLATFEPRTDEDLVVLDAARHETYAVSMRPESSMLISGAKFSRDDRWLAFHLLHSPQGTAQVWIAPVDGRRVVDKSEWIAVTDGKSRERDPSWSPAGNLLYFLSERDGFRCIWARKLDPKTKRPVAEAFPVQHFHFARQSLQPIGEVGYLTGLTAGGDRLVFTLAELTGNIWLAETRRN